MSLYHIETSPLIFRANQWTGFYIIGTPRHEQVIQQDQLIAFKCPNFRRYSLKFQDENFFIVYFCQIR